MSELELEQQMNIKFLVKLGKSGSEIRDMLVQVYRDNAMKATTVIFSNEVCSTFATMSLPTLLSDHIHKTGMSWCPEKLNIPGNWHKFESHSNYLGITHISHF
jgi:hypothetical protein